MNNRFLFTHQNQFMQAPYLFPDIRFYVFTAGYGAGKTSSIATSILFDIQQLKDKKDREGRNPRLLLGGVSLGHLKKTTLSYILSDLDSSKTKYTLDKKDNILFVGNVQIFLVSLTRPSGIVGFDVCMSYCDEIDDLGSVNMSSAVDMTFEAVKAVNERTRQRIDNFRQPAVKLASTSQGQRGLYRVVTQFDKEQTGYVRIKAKTKDNWSHPEGYVDSLYRFYTEQEAKVYLEGEFLPVGSGRIFPDFDWEHNFSRIPLDRQIEAHETLYWSQDFNMGFFRGCVAVFKGDTIFVVKRYEFQQILDAPQVIRHDFPLNKIIFIPDATSNKDVLTFAMELKRNNISWAFKTKNPNVEDTVFLVNKLLYTNRLVFTELAKESAEGCALAMRDPKTGQIPKGIGQRSPIHDIDCIRMLCYYLVFQPAMKDIRKMTVERRIKQWVNEAEDEEAPVTDIHAISEKGGYTLLSPAAINQEVLAGRQSPFY